jgi:hypothetical protein
MAGGIIAEFLPEAERTRILAAGLFLGGVAMLVVALMLEPHEPDDSDDEGLGKHRRRDDGDDGDDGDFDYKDYD